MIRSLAPRSQLRLLLLLRAEKGQRRESSGGGGDHHHHEEIVNPYNWRINKVGTFQDPWDYDQEYLRSQHIMYREPYMKEEYAKKDWIYAKIAGTMFWSYMLYHFYYKSEEIDIRKNPTKFPHMSIFTDEELGIPPDEEGLAPVKSEIMDKRIPNFNPFGPHDAGPMLLSILSRGDTGQFKF
ncbi:uncharacterized protein LOC141856149 [Brevipalpus obovatus]|uniref:uncharacterized protein LOC141856149 n=1 Tax=Brevipalpus obovatus TaxID=246614 RepID=UPI003D9E1096